MAESRFQRLQTLFDQALELPVAAHRAFIERECTDDPALAKELHALLKHELVSSDFLSAKDLDEIGELVSTALPGTEPPRQLGPYALHEVLGDGGMGRVFRATRMHDGIEQEVAIKVVRAELLNEGLSRRFSAERRLLAGLDHPGICRFLDAGTLAEGTPYVVMERVRGLPLLEYCDSVRLDLVARLQLLRKVCAAVAYAHSNLVIHRDIKPSNVLVDAHGDPKLLDFGIAKSLRPSADETSPAERFLTPSSAAPEQLCGDAVGVGCDIYALGALAFELLCARPPFDFNDLRASEIEHLLLRVPPPLMSQRVKDDDLAAAQARACSDIAALQAQLRGDLDVIVAKCLRKAASERYASVAQLDEDLARVLARQPISIRAGDTWYRARKFVARHQLGVALGGALGLTLIASAAVFVRQSLEVERQREQAVLERNRAHEVIEVLKDSFTAADPSGVMGADVRARDVLAAARPRIETLRDSQPGAFAALAVVLAEVEFELAMDTSANELNTQALLAARNASWQGQQLRPLLLLQARISTHQARYPEAQALLAEMTEIDGGEFRVDRALIEGRVLARLSKIDEAIVRLRQAFAATAELDVMNELALGVRLELANTLRRGAQLNEALLVYDEALTWLRKSLPEGHAKILNTRVRRLSVLMALARKEEAVDEAVAVAVGVAEAFGAESPMAAICQSMLGLALANAGRDTDAIPEFERAVSIWESRLGPKHLETARARFNLADALVRTDGLGPRAESLYLGAIDGAESAPGFNSNPALHMKIGYARRLHEANRTIASFEIAVAPNSVRGFDAARPDTRSDYLRLLRDLLAAAPCVAGKACAVAGELLTKHRKELPVEGLSVE